MDVVGIQGARIRLVPLDRAEHFENFLRWFNDPEITRWVSQFMPVTREAEEKWLERTLASEHDVVLAILDENGCHIGNAGLHSIDWRCRSAVTGTVIGEKDAWGKGYGTDVMRTRARWAFEELGLNRLQSECFAQNLASARCLEKTGYRRIGVARQAEWRHGAWQAMILWDLLAEDWFGEHPRG